MALNAIYISLRNKLRIDWFTLIFCFNNLLSIATFSYVYFLRFIYACTRFSCLTLFRSAFWFSQLINTRLFFLYLCVQFFFFFFLWVQFLSSSFCACNFSLPLYSNFYFLCVLFNKLQKYIYLESINFLSVMLNSL